MSEHAQRKPRVVRIVRCASCRREYVARRDGTPRAHRMVGLTWAAGYCPGSRSPLREAS